jgi:hypothetical protein
LFFFFFVFFFLFFFFLKTLTCPPPRNYEAFDIDYEVVQELGKGGFGKVLLVRNRKRNVQFAMKELEESGPDSCREVEVSSGGCYQKKSLSSLGRGVFFFPLFFFFLLFFSFLFSLW